MTMTDWESLGSMPPTTWSVTCDPYNRWAAQDVTSAHPLTATGRITLQNLVFFPLYVEPAVRFWLKFAHFKNTAGAVLVLSAVHSCEAKGVFPCSTR
jgi:hypothetical protein